jgi:hypothetical protein
LQKRGVVNLKIFGSIYALACLKGISKNTESYSLSWGKVFAKHCKGYPSMDLAFDFVKMGLITPLPEYRKDVKKIYKRLGNHFIITDEGRRFLAIAEEFENEVIRFTNRLEADEVQEGVHNSNSELRSIPAN